MSTRTDTASRPAAVVNAEIRALLTRRGGLSATERTAYEGLLVEWARAVRAEGGRRGLTLFRNRPAPSLVMIDKGHVRER